MEIFIKKILNLDRIFKQVLVYLIDITLFVFSSIIAIILRFDIYMMIKFLDFTYFFFGIVLFTILFLSIGLYRTIFRFSNLNILKIIFLAILIHGLLLFFINMFYLKLPQSIFIIQPIIFFIFVSVFRLYIPILISFISKKITVPSAVIYGAGINGNNLFNNLKNFSIKYFIDDNPSMIGKNISNKKIYAFKKITNYKEDNVTHVFVSFKIRSFEQKRLILDKFKDLDIVIRFIPEYESLAQPLVLFDKLLEINFEDLINKHSLRNMNYSSKNFDGLNILVTGGGGSIGSELCKQLSEFKIKNLVIIDNSEYNLYNINSILSNKNEKINIHPLLISVDNYEALELLYKKFDFDYVFHAAAYKHVPLIEKNIISSLRNNIIGSYNLAILSKKYNVKNLLLVSTDKAVNPTNIMGATKRISEKIFSSLADEIKDMNISIVRFGNVINSNGSVVPLFNKQIRNRGPVTVTHPEVTRYLMTIPDAVKLILETSIISKKYKSGLIYLLDMGKPIRIVDLAKKMINMYGFKVGKNINAGEIEIKYIGLREGEKLHEELYLTDKIKKTYNDKIFLVDEVNENFEFIENKINELKNLIQKNNSDSIINFLIDNVEGYKKIN
tara:strand:+ start:2402 stop:4240 length:1839 start_codon:yes stop_codon:yes gene_type:complete